MEHTKGKYDWYVQNENEIHADYDGRVGSIIATCWCGGQEKHANRIASLWNAADGMTTEEAVRYLEHGREMVELLRVASEYSKDTAIRDSAFDLLAKMESK